MIILRRLLDLSETILGALCVAAFLLMFVLGIATVVFRFVLESSLAFPDELIRYLFVWTVLLGAAVAFRRNLHAAIGTFTDFLPDSLRRATLLVATLACAVFFAILLANGYVLTLAVRPQISPALEVSMGYAYAAIPVGAFFLLIYTVELLVKLIALPVPEAIGEGGRD